MRVYARARACACMRVYVYACARHVTVKRGARLTCLLATAMSSRRVPLRLVNSIMSMRVAKTPGPYIC